MELILPLLIQLNSLLGGPLYALPLAVILLEILLRRINTYHTKSLFRYIPRLCFKVAKASDRIAGLLDKLIKDKNPNR